MTYIVHLCTSIDILYIGLSWTRVLSASFLVLSTTVISYPLLGIRIHEIARQICMTYRVFTEHNCASESSMPGVHVGVCGRTWLQGPL